MFDSILDVPGTSPRRPFGTSQGRPRAHWVVFGEHASNFCFEFSKHNKTKSVLSKQNKIAISAKTKVKPKRECFDRILRT